MKKNFIIILSLVFILTAFPCNTYALATTENDIVTASVQANVNKILETTKYSNSIAYAEYPIDIAATYDTETDLVTCTLSFNSNLKANEVKVQIYAIGGGTDAQKYSGTVAKSGSVTFTTSKTEHVVSFECDGYVYIGSLLLYEDGENEVLHDIFMSKFQILDFKPELSAYSSLSRSTANSLKAISSKQAENIVLDAKKQVVYEEAISDKCTYYFKVENGGLANLQFKADDPTAVYEVAVYFNAKHYNEKATDTLIGKFTVTGEDSVLPVLLPAGHKYITVTRLYSDKITTATRTSSAYGLILNELKWEDNYENPNIRNNTLGDALPLVGTPPAFSTEMISYYSNSNNIGKMNCYNYALNISYNLNKGYYSSINPESYVGMQNLFNYYNIWAFTVGQIAFGYNYEDGNVHPEIEDEDMLRSYMEEDASSESNTDTNTIGLFQAVNSTSVSPCPSYRYKIAYCYTDTSLGYSFNYHFYRQNPIESGDTAAKWSHKNGFGGSVSTVDDNNDDIYNPYWCDRTFYTCFGRFYTVRNPTVPN